MASNKKTSSHRYYADVLGKWLTGDEALAFSDTRTFMARNIADINSQAELLDAAVKNCSSRDYSALIEHSADCMDQLFNSFEEEWLIPASMSESAMLSSLILQDAADCKSEEVDPKIIQKAKDALDKAVSLLTDSAHVWRLEAKKKIKYFDPLSKWFAMEIFELPKNELDHLGLFFGHLAAKHAQLLRRPEEKESQEPDFRYEELSKKLSAAASGSIADKLMQ